MSVVSLWRKSFRRVPALAVPLKRVADRLIVPMLAQARGFGTPEFDPLWSRWEMLMRNYEPKTVDATRRLVTPGMLVLDIGEHVGYYSVLLSALVGRGGVVHAFEPNLHNYALLVENTRALQNVRPHAVALGDKDEIGTLHDAYAESGGSSLFTDPAGVTASHARARVARLRNAGVRALRCHIQIVTGDRYLESRGVTRVDFIKMDIEGAEPKAIKGLTDTLSRSRHLQLVTEFCPAMLRASGESPVAFLELLSSLFDKIIVIERRKVFEQSKYAMLVNTMNSGRRKANLLCLRK